MKKKLLYALEITNNEKHMKFKEPIKGKGMITLFRKSGYKTYLLDEFRTSCKCSKCDGGSCEKFMVRGTPKPFRNNIRLVHGLLSFTPLNI